MVKLENTEIPSCHSIQEYFSIEHLHLRPSLIKAGGQAALRGVGERGDKDKLGTREFFALWKSLGAPSLLPLGIFLSFLGSKIVAPDFTSLGFCYTFSQSLLYLVSLKEGLEQGSSFCLFFNSFSTVLAGSWERKGSVLNLMKIKFLGY